MNTYMDKQINKVSCLLRNLTSGCLHFVLVEMTQNVHPHMCIYLCVYILMCVYIYIYIHTFLHQGHVRRYFDEREQNFVYVRVHLLKSSAKISTSTHNSATFQNTTTLVLYTKFMTHTKL